MERVGGGSPDGDLRNARVVVEKMERKKAAKTASNPA